MAIRSEPQSQRGSDNLTEFLRELCELSYLHGIGINDGAVLYCLEHEDLERVYQSSNQSDLTFR